MEAPTSRLHEHYKRLEGGWKVSDAAAQYAGLVVPNGNSERPFHRWFHFKEGYSHRLLDRLLDMEGEPSDTPINVLDPFSGSGTTLLSAVERERGLTSPGRLQGIERNPVMHAISSAKLLGATAGASLAQRVTDADAGFWARYREVLIDDADSLTTQSATLNNETYFDPTSVRSLLALGRAARAESDPEVAMILLACVAISVEATGRLRRDGRALRFHPSKLVRSGEEAMRTSLDRAIEDMRGVSDSYRGSATIELADARTFAPDPEIEFNWAVFSPPYPNNIDYTEVYKAEAWALEVFRDSGDMKNQRLQTLRSHPSVLFPEEYRYQALPESADVDQLIDPLLEAIPDDRYRRGRTQLVKGYADDMLQVLTNVRKGMSASGKCAVVVGNSSHGHSPSHFVVASDLLVARLGELSGWRVVELRVARRPKRRTDSDGWLRESIVMFRCS